MYLLTSELGTIPLGFIYVRMAQGDNPTTLYFSVEFCISCELFFVIILRGFVKNGF